MKKLLLLPCVLMMISSCKDVSNEYRTCLMKAANQFMVSGEKATMDDLQEMCNNFEVEIQKMDIDEKNGLRAFMDSIMLNIETKTLFEGLGISEFRKIPCGAEFDVEWSKVVNDIPSNTDQRVISQKINYAFSKRPIICQALVERVFKRENGEIDLECKLFDDKAVYNTSFRLFIPDTNKDLIKPKTYEGNGIYQYQQVVNFDGTIDYWFKNDYGTTGFVVKVDNFSLKDY